MRRTSQGLAGYNFLPLVVFKVSAYVIFGLVRMSERLASSFFCPNLPEKAPISVQKAVFEEWERLFCRET